MFERVIGAIFWLVSLAMWFHAYNTKSKLSMVINAVLGMFVFFGSMILILNSFS